MLEWIARGLHGGRVTTRYPDRPEKGWTEGFAGAVDVIHETGGDAGLTTLCPTGAIAVDDGRVRLDRGRCVVCGHCVRTAPERFAFVPGSESATRYRAGLVVGADDDGDAGPVRAALGAQVAALRRSIHIRHVDAGSDGAEEWEIAALTNPYYDVQRLGLFFTASPRHADVLLVTGAVTHAMRQPLLRTYDVMPAPKAVVAIGADACGGGFTRDMGTTAGGVDAVLPVDVYVPGSPPSPIAILHGLLLAAGQLRGDER